MNLPMEQQTGNLILCCFSGQIWLLKSASSYGEILLSVAERFPDVYYVANEFPVEDNPEIDLQTFYTL